MRNEDLELRPDQAMESSVGIEILIAVSSQFHLLWGCSNYPTSLFTIEPKYDPWIDEFYVVQDGYYSSKIVKGLVG